MTGKKETWGGKFCFRTAGTVVASPASLALTAVWSDTPAMDTLLGATSCWWQTRLVTDAVKFSLFIKIIDMKTDRKVCRYLNLWRDREHHVVSTAVGIINHSNHVPIICNWIELTYIILINIHVDIIYKSYKPQWPKNCQCTNTYWCFSFGLFAWYFGHCFAQGTTSPCVLHVFCVCARFAQIWGCFKGISGLHLRSEVNSFFPNSTPPAQGLSRADSWAQPCNWKHRLSLGCHSWCRRICVCLLKVQILIRLIETCIYEWQPIILPEISSFFVPIKNQLCVVCVWFFFPSKQQFHRLSSPLQLKVSEHWWLKVQGEGNKKSVTCHQMKEGNIIIYN